MDTNNKETSKKINENLILENRKKIKIDGIIEILASNDSSISLKMQDTNLLINGSNINITKLDITTGTIEAEGLFESIKFGKSGNIFKRLFK